MVLSIIILSYNTKELTAKCVGSIVSQYEKELAKKEVEIIVVDNNSFDDSVESIKHFVSRIKYAGIEIIENKENFGFAKGCNIGEKVSRGEYVLFLNSDTEIKDKGLMGMVEFLKNNKKVGILGGKLLNLDGLPQPSAGKFYNLFNLFLMLAGAERLGFLRESPKTLKKVDWVSGACLMISKNIFDKLKGFDEDFFMYLEDMELCFRAKSLGYLTYFYPNASLFHKELGSSNRTFAMRHIFAGILYFYKKHKSKLEYNLAKFLLTTKAIFAISIGSLTGNNYLKNTYREAYKILV